MTEESLGLRICINLTDEEKEIIARGRAEYSKGTYIPLSGI